MNGLIQLAMDLPYRINLIGHDAWMSSGYAFDLAFGDVITNDGEILGTWRVVDYNPDADEEGGRYEFIPNGQTEPMFTEGSCFWIIGSVGASHCQRWRAPSGNGTKVRHKRRDLSPMTKCHFCHGLDTRGVGLEQSQAIFFCGRSNRLSTLPRRCGFASFGKVLSITIHHDSAHSALKWGM